MFQIPENFPAPFSKIFMNFINEFFANMPEHAADLPLDGFDMWKKSITITEDRLPDPWNDQLNDPWMEYYIGSTFTHLFRHECLSDGALFAYKIKKIIGEQCKDENGFFDGRLEITIYLLYRVHF